MADTKQIEAAAAQQTVLGDEKAVNVRVVVRCRPATTAEKSTKEPMAVLCRSRKEVVVLTAQKGKAVDRSFMFDQVYDANSSQEEVYMSCVEPIVDEVLQGFNCTVFAYGQTGTGKTHTMEGKFSSELDCKDAGVIPRSVNTIFQRLASEKKEYSVKISFLELYNEELEDLVTDIKDEKRQLKIFEDTTGKRGMMVSNLEEVIVNKSSEVFAILEKALQKRKVAATNLNQRSSRSHSVFTITIHTKEIDAEGEEIIKVGKLNLVDLAGSECVAKSGAKNQQAKEAGKINKSLLTLGRVINALVEKLTFVPYRDSKLTRLLQESLGGKAKTVIIATVSPSQVCVDESLSTLDYAHRAKNIRNRPQVNQKMTKKAYIKELLDEILLLKQQNEACRSKNGIYLPPEQLLKMEMDAKQKDAKLEEIELTLKAKESEINELNEMFKFTTAELDHIKSYKKVLESQLSETESELDNTVTVLTSTAKQLDEHKHVVKAQAMTEQALTTQAQELQTTLTTVIDDKNKLHSKIVRKDVLEENNLSAAQKFKAAAATTITSLQTATTAYKDTHTSGVESWAAGVTEYTTSHAADVSTLGSSLSAHNQKLASHSERVSGLVASHASQVQAQSNAAMNARINSISATNESLKSVHSKHGESSAAISNTIAQQTKDIASFQAATSSMIAEQTSSVQSHCDQSVTEFKTLQSAVDKQSAAALQQLKVTEAAIVQMAKDQTESVEAAMTALTSTVITLIDQFRSAHAKSLTKAVSELREQITTQATAIQQATTANRTHLDGVITAHHKYVSDRQTANTTAEQNVKAGCTGLTARGATAAQQIEESAKQLQTGLFATMSAIDSQIPLIRDETAKQNEAVSAFATAHSQWLTTQQTEREAFNTAQTGVTTQLKDRAVAFAADMKDCASESVATCDQHHSSLSSAFTALSQSVTKFVSDELKSYTVTGATPIKKEWKFPTATDLAKTTEHKQLIAEFHASGQYAGPTDAPVAPLIAATRVNKEERKQKRRASKVQPPMPKPRVKELSADEKRQLKEKEKAAVAASVWGAAVSPPPANGKRAPIDFASPYQPKELDSKVVPRKGSVVADTVAGGLAAAAAVAAASKAAKAVAESDGSDSDERESTGSAETTESAENDENALYYDDDETAEIEPTAAAAPAPAPAPAPVAAATAPAPAPAASAAEPPVVKKTPSAPPTPRKEAAANAAVKRPATAATAAPTKAAAAAPPIKAKPAFGSSGASRIPTFKRAEPLSDKTTSH